MSRPALVVLPGVLALGLTNGRARAVRSTTLEAVCAAPACLPGDLLRRQPDPDPTGDAGAVAVRGPEQEVSAR